MTSKVRSRQEVREWLLEELEQVIQDQDQKTSDRLRAINMMGVEHGLFVEQRKVQIDVKGIVQHLTNQQLNGLVSRKEISDGQTIDVEFQDSTDHRDLGPLNAHVQPLDNLGEDPNPRTASPSGRGLDPAPSADGDRPDMDQRQSEED